MITHTDASVLFEIGKPLRLVRLALPPLKSGQVLVDVAYSGVCRTQLMETQGLKGPDKFLPHTLGHEGSGIVRAIGPDVTKVKADDHVVLTWIKGQGKDVPSTVYQCDFGPVNSGAISTFMRCTVTCENRVVPIPDSMPLRDAALLGCAIPTGAGIVFNTACVQKGQSVAVFGIGGVGSSAVLAAAVAGASPLIAVDVADDKLRLARELGATHAVNAQSENAVEKLLDITRGRGADVTIESAGRKEAMEAAFGAVRDNGGLCVIAGNLARGSRIGIDPFDLIRGRRIIGTWGGETVTDRDIPRYVQMCESSVWNIGAMISGVYPLARINEALNDADRGVVARVLIDMNA